MARRFQGEDREYVTFSTKTQRFTDGLARRLQGEAREDDAFQTAASSSISPAALHPLSATHIPSDVPFGNQQGGLSPLLSMPPCYSGGACSWCLVKLDDQASAAVAVSAAETKRLMDAHIRFGHRNFRSLAKALNLRMPPKIPFCRACVEAKSTRHPKSVFPAHYGNQRQDRATVYILILLAHSPRDLQTVLFMACFSQMHSPRFFGLTPFHHSKTGSPV